MSRLARLVLACASLVLISPGIFAAVVVRDKTWQPGATLQVCFIGGGIQRHQRIASTASEWSRAGNIKFDFGKPEDPRKCDEAAPSDIRVTTEGHGSWSYLGTAAKAIPPGKPTMTLALAEELYQSGDILRSKMLILREFGHALGFRNEVQSPNSPCDVDLNQATAMGFSHEYTKSNLEKMPRGDNLYIGSFDPKSVMINDGLPLKPLGPPCSITGPNATLSAEDKVALAAIYGPPQTPSPGPQAATATVLSIPFKRTIEQAGILNRDVILAALVDGFSSGVAAVDPHAEIERKLTELAEIALRNAVASLTGAVTAYRQNDYQGCIKLLISPASVGDTNAQLILAQITYFGLGTVPENKSGAAQWISAAAAIDPLDRKVKGNPAAAYLLAIMSIAGIGTEKNSDTAVSLLIAAGEAGFPDAYLRLGQMYVAGIGNLPQNFAQATSAFGAAAGTGNPIAKLSQAVVDVEGLTQQDETLDVKALLDAAASQLAWAKFYQAILYADGIALPKDVSRANELLTEAADSGLPVAQATLGFSYETGQLNVADLAKAKLWYGKAVQHKSPVAAFRLGALIASGKIDQNTYPVDAVSLVKASAESGFPDAQYRLALIYREGNELPQDYVSAAAWLIIAAARLNGPEKDRALADRDQIANQIGKEQYGLAQQRASSIFNNAGWVKKGVQANIPWIMVPSVGDLTPLDQGSGFFVSQGYVLTNYHVVNHKCDVILAKLPGEELFPLDSPIHDDTHDLAVMRVIRLNDTPTAHLRVSGVTLPMGIYAAGFPLPGKLNTSEVSLDGGQIAQFAGLQGDLSRWRITARIHKGNSGGPILDDAGNVVGVAVAGLNDKDGQDIAFAFKASLIEALFGDIIKMDTHTDTTTLGVGQLQKLAERLVVPVTCMVKTGNGS